MPARTETGVMMTPNEGTHRDLHSVGLGDSMRKRDRGKRDPRAGASTGRGTAIAEKKEPPKGATALPKAIAEARASVRGDAERATKGSDAEGEARRGRGTPERHPKRGTREGEGGTVRHAKRSRLSGGGGAREHTSKAN